MMFRTTPAQEDEEKTPKPESEKRSAACDCSIKYLRGGSWWPDRVPIFMVKDFGTAAWKTKPVISCKKGGGGRKGSRGGIVARNKFKT